MKVPRHSLIAAPSLLFLLPGLCSAQAFNIDIGPATAVPDSTYGAVTGQVGEWQAISTGTTTGLTDVLSNSTSVSVSLSGGPIQFQDINNFWLPSTPPSMDLENLFDDYVPGNPNVQARFDGLATGRYSVYIYAWAPDGMGSYYVSVTNPGPGKSMVHGPDFPVPEYLRGVNFESRVLNVTAGSPLFVTALCEGSLGQNGEIIIDGGGPGGPGEQVVGEFGPDCTIAGIQIIPVIGDQSCVPVTPNSVGGRPRVTAFGTTDSLGRISKSANDLVLAAGVLPGSVPNMENILVYVSNNSNPGVAFPCSASGMMNQDSFRCVGSNPATDLYRAGALSTLTNASGIYSLAVDFSSLPPALIDTSVGSTLNFQMVYTDDLAATDACSDPNKLRWTSMRTLVVGP